MAIAAWKRLEKSPGYQQKKLFFKRLLGKELRLRPELRVDYRNDGGWRYCADGLGSDSIVYSLGVGEDVRFDLSLIDEFGVELHAFDPTPNSVDMLSERSLPAAFHFHPWAVAAADGNVRFYPRVRKDGSRSAVMYTTVADDTSHDGALDVPAYTLQSITARLGHDRVDLLKMDIEGAEYEVLDGLLAGMIRPGQLLVEFHHRFPGIGLGKTAAMIDRLRDTGYRIFAISETGREFSFLYRP